MEVTLGKIVSTYGIKGEVKVISCTDFASKRYKKGNEVILYDNNSKNRVTLKIASYKKIKNLDIISFENLLDINLIEKFIGCEIFYNLNDDRLNDDQYYYCDLIDCNILFENKKIGKVIEIISMGKDKGLRILKQDGKTIIYPFIERFINKIDIDNKVIIINPIEGMI